MLKPPVFSVSVDQMSMNQLMCASVVSLTVIEISSIFESPERSHGMYEKVALPRLLDALVPAPR
jgi:hypothetical protein